MDISHSKTNCPPCLVPEGWLPLLLEHGHVLDLVLQAMTCHPGDSRLQHYSVSFLALLVSVGEDTIFTIVTILDCL